MTIITVEYDHLLAKARDVARAGRGSWNVLSTGERVTVALVLNRADWLADIGFTLADAIERTGPDWLRMVPIAAKQLLDDAYRSNDPNWRQ